MSSHRNLDTLQGLLRFAVEHTKSEDAKSDSAYADMDPDRKTFLENAMKSLTVDLIQELEKAIQILESETATIDEKLTSLEMIEELACDMDLSNNFLKIGGSRIVMKCLNSNEPRMRSAAAKLLGEITQNNVFGQKHFTDLLVITKLIEMLNCNDNIDLVRNSLHALSCLVREYEPALAFFIDKNGLENLLMCLNINEPRITAKASFFISAISTEFSIVRDELIKLNAIEKLCVCLNQNVKGEYDAKLENILSALNTLTDDDNEIGKNALKNSKSLQEKLSIIIENNKNAPECEEIVMYANNLIKKL